jgi:DNA-binding beta-propeller fold protein YncE
MLRSRRVRIHHREQTSVLRIRSRFTKSSESKGRRIPPLRRLAIAALGLGALLALALAIPALGSGGTSLSFQECFNANGGGCASSSNAGLGNADAIALSPDGKSVYVASQSDDGVVRFDRDTSTGALTYEGCFTSDSSGCAVDNLPSMVDAQGVAVSPDGKSVYVTSFSEGSVDHFERNTTSGELTYKDCVSSRSFGCGSGDEVPGLSGAWGIAVSPDGKDVYVAAEEREAIVSFARNETTGSLTDEGCLSVHNVGCGAGNGAAPGVVGATDVAVSPDGNDVYVAGGIPGESGWLSTFKRSTGGALTYEGCATSTSSGCAAANEPGMVSARGVAISPDGKSVYVASETSNAVARFSRNMTSGALSYDDCLTSESSGCATNSVTGLKGAFGLAVSPDGASVYVTSLGHDDALVRLERNTTSGALSFGECFTHQVASETPCGAIHVRSSLPGLAGAERVAASPDGQNVYVAALGESAVAVFGSAAGEVTRHVLSVAKSGTGAGTVTSSPTGIECGPVCAHTYTDGTKVTLTAAPEAGSTFTGWSGAGCGGTGACEVTISADVTVTAGFAAASGGGGGPAPGGGGTTPPPGGSPPPKKALKCPKGSKKKKVKGRTKCVKSRHKAGGSHPR